MPDTATLAPVPDLIDWLGARQEALGLTQRQFAAKLEVPESTWLRHRTRERGVTWALWLAALRAFPEQRDELVSVAQRMSIGHSDVTNSNTGPTVRAGAGARAIGGERRQEFTRGTT